MAKKRKNMNKAAEKNSLSQTIWGLQEQPMGNKYVVQALPPGSDLWIRQTGPLPYREAFKKASEFAETEINGMRGVDTMATS